MTQHNLFYTVKILSIIGIGLAVYLLIEQSYPPAQQLCHVNSTINCSAITTGAIARTVGIPTPLYGLFGYIAILFAVFIKNRKLLLGMSLFGALFCLRITLLEVFVLHVLCPVCIICQIIILVLVMVGIFLIRKK